MLINRKNYSLCLKALEEEEGRLCEQLLQMFKECDIKHLNIGCIGNSIASGYSKGDEMLPFFARTKLCQFSHNINFYSFARIRRNEEANILKWYNQNISHKDINWLLIDDLRIKQDKYVGYGAIQRQRYEELMNHTDIGFKEYIQLKDNIAIYHGLTGTFTNAFRKGNFKERIHIWRAFRRDFEYLKMFLTQIYMDNPKIQVYICGLPDILGIGLTSLFDSYIKRATQMVPNAIYLKGVSKNIFMLSENQKELDYHYNKPEYLWLLCRAWKSILDNYISVKLKNDILFELSEYSDAIEKKDTAGKGCAEDVRDIVINCEKKYAECLKKYGIGIESIRKEIWIYYNRNYLEKYGCTRREDVRKVLLES